MPFDTQEKNAERKEGARFKECAMEQSQKKNVGPSGLYTKKGDQGNTKLCDGLLSQSRAV